MSREPLFVVDAVGTEVSVDSPHPHDVQIYPVAWALAQVNRFTGHALRPYSVAEHSLLVCDLVDQAGGNVHAQLAALLHDAHEAYTGDMHSPGKQALGDAWHRWERLHESAVRSAFAIHTAASQYARQIKQADLIALATEKRDLMHPSPHPWLCLAGVQPAAVRLNTRAQAARGWEDWRDAFLDRFHQLDLARNDVLRAGH
jgi:uncharacterized protein